jgi:putative transposase
MSQGITLFHQLQGLLPRHRFAAAVAAVSGDHKVHRATCWSHAQCLLLGLLLGCRSLRDLSTALRSRLTYLRQFGVGSVDRSTLSHAGIHRPGVVMNALFTALLAQVQARAPRHPFRFRGKLLSLDATVIHVSTTLFAWARSAKTDCGVKLHVHYNHAGGIPEVVELKTVRVSELHLAKQRTYAPGTVLVMDRGYFECAWLAALHRAGVVFVTRLPPHVLYRVLKRKAVPPDSGLISDEQIRFSGPISGCRCPVRLRVICYCDPVTGKELRFLTNQLQWSALTICRVYKARWQIELFFKWMKQNLKVKTFYGRSENAVHWQLMAALCLYLLLTLLKLMHNSHDRLIDIQRLLDQHLFVQTTIDDVLKYSYQFQT